MASSQVESVSAFSLSIFPSPLSGQFLFASLPFQLLFLVPVRLSFSLLFLLVVSSVVLNPVSISSSYWDVYANSNNSTTPSTDSVVPDTNVTSQGTTSNLSLQNPVINSTIASIDKNIKSSMDQPKLVPAGIPYGTHVSKVAEELQPAPPP